MSFDNKDEKSNSRAQAGAESQTEDNHPADLIGRTVGFLSRARSHKPRHLRGVVIGAGRIPDTVVIKAVAGTDPVRSMTPKQRGWRDAYSTGGALYCRFVSDIEVLA